MGPRTQPEQVYSTNRDIKTQDAFGLLTIMTYMLSAGIHRLPQMILWVMIHTPFKEDPLADLQVRKGGLPPLTFIARQAGVNLQIALGCC